MRLKLLRSSSCAVLFATAAVAAAGSAAAQDTSFARDHNVGVRDRRFPGYDALGLRAGSFLLFPWAEAGVVWSDNIFATPVDEQSDTVLTLSAALRAQSQWSRHALNGFVEFNNLQYMDFTDESHAEWGVGADGRLDLARGTNVSAGAQYHELVQPRSDASTPVDALEPVTYNLATYNGSASHEVGRFRLGGDIGWSGYRYDAVQTLFNGLQSQSYRNEDVFYGGVRLDYALSPAVAVYGSVRGNDRSFQQQPNLTDDNPQNDVDRDSSGWDVGVGVDFDLTHAARGHILIGYLEQDYEDPDATTTDGLAMDAWVEWFPTQMTTVTLSADQSINDTTVGDAAGTLTTALGIRVDHELRRNLILWGRANWAQDDYDGISRVDDRVDYGVGADLKFNRLVAARISFQHFDRTSSGGDPGFEYTEDRFGAVLVLHP
ncbi:outer membrane beta-barrel protein [Caulobacter sp. 17J65-9]|uniref:outer membrane beta-barrel protein n=1 Tax=Caulobacter sp. 17J65-9 TaxID=2709382 RepID=UPI0013C70B16|nr:outer membrane beta-barrel protein [Caulobacter sp. 17J65-9]NEX94074.1 outer membrane beta-barrel protein [Caulobacter sp. 17J65-9]